MSLRHRHDALRAAQAAHLAQREAAATAWRGLKAEVENGLTPGRVLGVGLLGGFLAGLATPAGKPSSGGLFARLLRLLLDGTFNEVRAAMAAGAAMAQADPGVARGDDRQRDA